MGNIVPIRENMIHASKRWYYEMTAEEFANADENGDWSRRVSLNGFTILIYDRSTFIRDKDGGCIMVLQNGTDIRPFISTPPEFERECEHI